ncbi:MAG: hypothetical protein HYR75_08050 [Gemmatimonadetes bacterium]|nr:hypothetical protein [Gemmatimonadota bacterium]MBI3504629.1 hypothetical protein [Pseudomonadota bacterium]
MLAYLDALVTAVRAGDAAEVERLLAHPLARILSREAAHEARAALQGTLACAPLRLLQLRHQTAHLLGEPARPSAESRAVPPSAARVGERRPAPRHQMELPLSA